jgi:hypothetical protein
MKEIQIIGSAKKIERELEYILGEVDILNESFINPMFRQDMWQLADKIKIHTDNIIKLCKGD